MKKLTLGFVALFMNLFGAFAQTESNYDDRKLSIEEVNFVTSYYAQEGNNAAVTGGIGSEHLTDFANQLDLRLIKKDKKDRIHTIIASIGLDNYSSASSDKIDPTTISSASSGDTRFYPKLGWTVNNEKTGWSYGAIASFSNEYDYTSFGIGLNVAKTSADKNRELALNVQAYFDTWTAILPVELRPPGSMGKDGDDDNSATQEPRNSISGSLTFSQVVNKRLQIAFMLDGIYQQGLLATRFHRVYLTDGTVRSETLPDNRLKIPIGVRANYFLGNNIILRGYYRFYTDDWGLTAHTASIEVPIKINPYLSVSPNYRYYDQSAVKYFAAYGQHTPSDQFYTSDYDLSKFNSHLIGTGIRWAPESGVFGVRQFAVLELRYGHYIRSTGLTSDIITLGMKFK